MNKTKKALALFAAALCTSAAMNAANGTDADSVDIFIFSPGPGDGLHVAQQTPQGWHDMGRVCSSDYGTWGAEKKMYHPSVAHAKDGTWRLVFQVNDHSPVIAAAYSRDLITWRPQDYPRMSATKCLNPIVKEKADGRFSVYFDSPQGKRRSEATPNFRCFDTDQPAANAPSTLWQRDTATIGGKMRQGDRFTVATDVVAKIAYHQKQSGRDWQLSNERMHDDGTRFSSLKSPISATLTVENDMEKPISDKLIGIFFEDISYAADGGLYAEMVQNRDFEYTPADHGGWNATTAWHSPADIRIESATPLSQNNPHYAVVTSDSLWNEGWDGMAVEKGKKYDFSIFAKGKKTIVVKLLAKDGSTLAQATVNSKQDGQWQQLKAVLTAKKTEANARLLLLPKGKQEAAIDMVSLFPQETFMNRKNGLRRDLAETIARMKPRFVRFPGGCMSHGQGLDNIYHWHHTVGPLQDRKPDFNIWHYHQTRGLGFFEYFQFCEDIGAEPLPVLAAGVPCQNSANNREGMGGQQGGIPMNEMPAYIEELLNLIEWANGDPATSPWAKMRADAGHPEPFNLKYIGIGNEDIISTVFEERYEMICRAIREKYPDIRICGTVGPFHTPSADYLEGWDLCRRHPDLQFMTDEHYYESTGWFLHHRDYYDHYDREGTKVYLGEWAASTRTKRPNVETALAEALYLTDIERNGDVVHMTSYAPMLCKEGHSNWNPDMIYFTNTEVRTTMAYEVQRLFGNYSGNRYVSSRLKLQDPELAYRLGASVVRDSKTGRTCVKLVNALPVEVQLSVEGLSLAGATGEGFSGKPEDAHAPCQPLTLGDRITLPPYSFQVVVLK